MSQECTPERAEIQKLDEIRDRALDLSSKIISLEERISGIVDRLVGNLPASASKATDEKKDSNDFYSQVHHSLEAAESAIDHISENLSRL